MWYTHLTPEVAPCLFTLWRREYQFVLCTPLPPLLEFREVYHVYKCNVVGMDGMGDLIMWDEV